MENNKIKERLEIITPFLENKKSLKTISEEFNISYSTLKRWVKSYKELGISGLDIKKRNDKNSFRKVDSSSIKKIESIYKKNKEKNLTELYKKVKNSLISSLSFNTFYRIVSNLDSYLKNKSSFQISKNLKNGEVYILKSFTTYHFVLHNNKKQLPLILLAFNASTLDFVDFHIYFYNKFDFEFLAFIRKIILKGWKNYSINYLPKEFLIDTPFVIPKKIKEEIFNTTSIKLLNFEIEHEEITIFINQLEKDLNLSFNEVIRYEDFYEFLKNYSIYYNLKEESKPDIATLKKLDIFLSKTIRKIDKNGVRVNNIFYNSNFLKPYIGKSFEIIFDPLDKSYIIINLNNDFKFISLKK